MAPLRTTDVEAVTAAVRSIAPEAELSVRLLVLMVPVGSEMLAPELMVTELVPFRVFRIETA